MNLAVLSNYHKEDGHIISISKTSPNSQNNLNFHPPETEQVNSHTLPHNKYQLNYKPFTLYNFLTTVSVAPHASASALISEASPIPSSKP